MYTKKTFPNSYELLQTVILIPVFRNKCAQFFKHMMKQKLVKHENVTTTAFSDLSFLNIK